MSYIVKLSRIHMLKFSRIFVVAKVARREWSGKNWFEHGQEIGRIAMHAVIYDDWNFLS